MSSRVALISIFSLAVGITNATAAPVSVDASAGSALTGRSSIGLTFSTTTRPYVGIGTQNALLPYFSFSANQFYIRGLNLGYTAANTDKYTLDLIATPSFLGYGNDDSPELATLESTNYSIHGGVSLTLPIKAVQLNTQIVTDLLGESGGTEITSTLSHTRSFDKFTLTAAAGVNWQDEKLVDHYYGVDGNSSSDTLASYTGNAATNFRASLTSSFALTDSITTIGTVSINQYGDEIANSPIVDNEQTTALSLGIIYSF